MKPYGLERNHGTSCCPGHADYGGNKWVGHYKRIKHRLRQLAKKAARTKAKREISQGDVDAD